MLEPVAASEVLNAILAGEREWEVAPKLRQLSSTDRQNLLCTVCAMRDEIARNCWSTAAEVNALLTTECPFYVHGSATCRF
jgi:hypothetical protein